MTSTEKLQQFSLPGSLKAERQGDIAILRLARPEKRNALNDETIQGIDAFFSTLPTGVKAVVLAAEGDTFSAGPDLSQLSVRTTIEGVGQSLIGHPALQRSGIGGGSGPARL